MWISLLPTAKRRGNVFGGVCLYVCLCVRNTISFESLDVESSFSICRDSFQRIWVRFEYEGRRVEIKVTVAKKARNLYSRNVKFQNRQ